MLVGLHAQYQGPALPKWDRAIINVINHTRVYPATARHDGCWEKKAYCCH